MNATFASKLLTWYSIHQRNLPWRTTRDPYKIWISEVILQQTRIIQGIPYYERFISRYPSVQQLADAPQEEVLRLWQGLGYYSRARNLHACARIITQTWGGIFPNTYEALLGLPGVGPYTAAAIASIAFDVPVPVIDGNVYRVLARIFGITLDITSVQGVHLFRVLARTLLPEVRAGKYNQALMEFGALHCTPRSPKCATCVFAVHCAAFQTRSQSVLPVKRRKLKLISRHLHYLVIQYEDKLYMKQRSARGIWGGMYDFYLVETPQFTRFTQLSDALVALVMKHKVPVTEQAIPHKHLLTHQQLYITFSHIHATQGLIEDATKILVQAGVRAIQISQTESLPKPIVIARFLQKKIYV